MSIWMSLASKRVKARLFKISDFFKKSDICCHSESVMTAFHFTWWSRF